MAMSEGRGSWSHILSSLVLVLCGGMSPAQAADPLEHRLVRGDPAAEAIVGHLQALDATAPIEVLAKSRLVDPVTGNEYTLLKVRHGPKDVVATINEQTGVFAPDRGLPHRERQAVLEALPPVYGKMGSGLLATVRQAQGGVLGAATGGDTVLDMAFYAGSSESLDAIEQALGDAAFTRLDVPDMFTKTPPVVRPSKDGTPNPPAPAPQVRAVFAKLRLADVLSIAGLDAVVHLELRGSKSAQLDRSVPRIKGDVVKGFGLDGFDADIGVVDSGVDNTHPDLDTPLLGIDLVIAEADFTGAGGADPSDDTHGHGTHVAGISINTSAGFEGMAPWSDVISAKVLHGGAASGADATINAGTAWARGGGADILNLSLGGAPTGGAINAQDPVSRQCGFEVFTSNRTVCVAVGNTGTNVVQAPADAFNVITVGATELQAGAAEPIMAGFSTFGPMEGRSKPDVVAPGDNVGADEIDSCAHDWEDGRCTAPAVCWAPPANVGNACAVNADCDTAPGDGDGRCNLEYNCDVAADCDVPPGAGGGVCTAGARPDFVDMAGTSMSTPHVAGLAALLWDWGGDHGMLNDTPYLKATIINTCNRLAGWASPGVGQPLDPHQGAGEVDAEQAFREYADDLRVWQQRVTGTDDDHSHWYWIDFDGAGLPSDDPKSKIVVTLVFERHVTNPAVAAPALNDLDLYLYDPACTEIDASNSLVDSVEHIVHTPAANGRYCIEVDPFDLSQDGWEFYAVACNYRLHFLGTTCPCIPDFGDAPDPFTAPGAYPTLLANNGARHLDWTKEWLGTSRPEIDGELEKGTLAVHSRVDPFPSVSGENDANDPNDQDGVINLVDRDFFDDGVTFFGAWVPLAPALVFVTVQTNVHETGVGPTGRYDAAVPTKRLYLNAWADWNGDGDWVDAGEKIIGTWSPTGTVAIDPATFGPNGQYTIGEAYVDANGSGEWEPGEAFTDTVGFPEQTFVYVVIPPAVLGENIFCRFRLDYGEDVANVANVSGNLIEDIGAAQFGEVEDYWFERDYFPDTEATVEVRTPQGTEVVTFTGPTTVMVEMSGLGDADSDGLEEVPTEIVEMELTGDSIQWGTLTLRVRPETSSPYLRSTGTIEENANSTPGVLNLPPFAASGSATSVFDVYFEIDIAGETYHNIIPKQPETVIYQKPPGEGDTYYDPDTIPLYDENDVYAGVDLLSVGHTPRPETVGACCIGNDVCINATPTMCQEWAGAYQGAGTDCATADCAWACPGTMLACNSSQDIDNSVNSDHANPPMTCATGDSVGLLWFTFVATDVSVKISTCASAGGDDSVFALYGGDCFNTLVELACSEDGDCGSGDGLGKICYAGLTVGATYYVQLASGDADSQGQYDLEIECPCADITPAACCLADGSCVTATPSQCAAQDGYYQGPGTVCLGDANSNGFDDACETGACCMADGSCVESASELCGGLGGVSVVPGATCIPNPCDGACCTFFLGSYTCADSAAASCVGPNDTWYEDEQCAVNFFACPDDRVCDIRTDGTRCQAPAIDSAVQGTIAGVSDRNPQTGNGNGTHRADDFRPYEPVVSQVCWWGQYEDVTTQGAPECRVFDSFTITYYQDVEGCVGPVIAQVSEAAATLTVTRTYSGQRDGSGTMVWLYEGVHVPVAMIPGDCYWIEIVNDTDDGTGLQTCVWLWQTSPFAEGNGFSLADEGAPGSGFPCGDQNTQRSYDLAFCLDVPNDPCWFCSDLCGPGSIPEGEPQCYDYYDDVYNIGCSDENAPSPPLMTYMACGETICGYTGTFDCDIDCVDQSDCPVGEQCQTNGTCTGGPYNCRDVDWYRFVVSETSTVEYCVTADFPVYTAMFDTFGMDECQESLGQLALVVPATCQAGCGQVTLQPGAYYILIEPNMLEGLPCVDDWTYVLQLTCTPVGGSECVALDARSLRDHGASGELYVQMGVSGGIDPRLGGITKLEIDVDDASGFGGGVTVVCSQSGDISGTVSATSVNGNTVTVEFSAALPNQEACTVTLDCSAEVCVIGLEGDTDGNGVVATTDAGIVKPRFGEPADNTNARFDVDCNGFIATTDFGVVKPKFGNVADPCP